MPIFTFADFHFPFFEKIRILPFVCALGPDLVAFGPGIPRSIVGEEDVHKLFTLPQTIA